jgi:formate hydrogenlyase transcriptional activator
MADPTISPPELLSLPVPDHSRRQLEALLDVSKIIAQHRDLKTLFHELADRLQPVVESDFLALVLHDSSKNVMRLHVLETREEHHKPVGTETPVDGNPSGWVWQTQQPFISDDILTESRFPEFLPRLRESGVRSFATLPLTTAQRRLGAIGFGRLLPKAISDSDIKFMQRVAAQVAVAVDNALNFESAQAYQLELAEQRDRLQVLLDINNVLVTSRELVDLFRGIVSALTRVMHHDYTSLALLDTNTNLLKIHALDFDGSDALAAGKEITVPLDQSPAGRCMLSAQPAVFHGVELDQFPAEIVRILRGKGLTSVCCVPLVTKGRAFGTLNLASRRVDAFTDADAELLNRVAAQIAIAVENALAFKEIDSLKDKLAVEKLYLEEEIRSEFNFEEIVGESAVIKRALAQVELAAPGNTTVLVLGETGTGKELIARAIHNLSPRRERTFVKINCAAIPSGLLESELFGHERGAFTGAIAQKVGRFELADRGTIFLDEVGDIPLELQPKLLRVLQEQEFERLGATRTIRVDARVVAATNADLSRLVAERAFRSDLYYRLNVFPIQIPPLRDRREDIPLLVRYFVQKFSRRLNKTVHFVPADAMDALVSYSWPGNIRELENLLERAVILSPGKELRVPLAELRNSAVTSANDDIRAIANPGTPVATLEEAERQHILRALRQTQWRIAGPRGAANMLGMKRTTLQARIRKLGIRRPI